MDAPKRRLSAVWFADIVGYTSLSGRDEEDALELVRRLQRLARRVVEQDHDGRVVKFIGDAVLAEFSSADAAVRAATALRDRYAADANAAGIASELRVAVHLGEVVATPDGDLYGDGINTAARLQDEAEPGQVLASEDVWRQLRQRPEFRFESLGELELRGITARVGVFDVAFGARAARRSGSAAAIADARSAPRLGGRKLAGFAAAGAIGAVALVGLLGDGPGSARGTEPDVPDSAAVEERGDAARATDEGRDDPADPAAAGAQATVEPSAPASAAAGPAKEPAASGREAAASPVSPSEGAAGPEQPASASPAEIVRPLIERFARALETGDEALMRRIFPALTAEHETSFRTFHERLDRGASLSIGDVRERPLGDRRIGVQFELRVDGRRGARRGTPAEIHFLGLAVRDGTEWRFAMVRARR